MIRMTIGGRNIGLRSIGLTDLINLKDDDIDMKTMALRIQDGKFGKSAILPIPQSFVQILEQYPEVRPGIEIDGRFLVFYTDLLNRWNRKGLEMIFADLLAPMDIHCSVVDRLISKWTAKQCAAVMYKREGYNLKEIGEKLNISFSAVCRRLKKTDYDIVVRIVERNSELIKTKINSPIINHKGD